jgi:hypothetical protein
MFMEVISTPTSSAAAASSTAAAAASPQEQHQQHPVVAHQGVLYAVQQTQQQLLLLPHDWQLQPDHQLVKALPGWSTALQQQQAKQRLPKQPLQLQSAAVVSSAAQLQAAVRRNSALWRDGTGEPRGACMYSCTAGVTVYNLEPSQAACATPALRCGGMALMRHAVLACISVQLVSHQHVRTSHLVGQSHAACALC